MSEFETFGDMLVTHKAIATVRGFGVYEVTCGDVTQFVVVRKSDGSAKVMNSYDSLNAALESIVNICCFDLLHSGKHLAQVKT